MLTKITSEAPDVLSLNLTFKLLCLFSVLTGPIQASVKNMIRNVYVMTSTMAVLPNTCTTSLKLSYYEDGIHSCITFV